MRTLTLTKVAAMKSAALVLFFWTSLPVLAADAPSPNAPKTWEQKEAELRAKTETLKEPLYTPFIERYLIDEVKNLRVEMNRMEVDLNKAVVDRELETVSKVANYATDTVTYFFYLIAGLSSILVIVGWSSFRDIKDKVKTLADSKVNKVVDEYEKRLEKLENDLYQKTKGIDSTQRRLTKHQDIHSLWLKAGQENLIANKIAIYDQILELDPNDTEAMTYKADAALELNEPRWAINLCQQALEIDPNNPHAYYQLAGAFTLMDQNNDALMNLEKSIELSGQFSEQILEDPIFDPLKETDEFKQLIETHQKPI